MNRLSNMKYRLHTTYIQGIPSISTHVRQHFSNLSDDKSKQARNGFRPPSAMKGMGYFQNLRNFLGIFLEESFGGIF